MILRFHFQKSTIISDDEDDDVNDDEDSDDENPGSEVKTTEEDSDVDVSALVQKIKVSKPVTQDLFHFDADPYLDPGSALEKKDRIQ